MTATVDGIERIVEAMGGEVRDIREDGALTYVDVAFSDDNVNLELFEGYANTLVEDCEGDGEFVVWVDRSVLD